ncbi:glycosyltransferase family 2 protein [Pseudomonas yangonensis]|uniref:glycosyltransferase family 2 protein n=1 Tax=Pseudomonas yangonensis TaxID=2579922 RepID=UPI001F36E6E8|nr:glycosyltransferase [Pseudomonas yangonensis]
MSRLHRKPGHPYYIVAPEYRETSSGIQALHYLCHALNLEGREAYIAGTSVTSLKLKTPLLDEATRERHRREGLEPIAVYPEVTAGNCLNTSVVVRYVLNKRGLLAEKEKGNEDDLLFYFRREFYDGNDPDGMDLLRLQTTDVELFSLPKPPRPRFRKLLYLNRIPYDQVDISSFPETIEVLSMATPLSLSALAERLQEAEVLYSYESSSTCSKAIMCGCPVVALKLPGYERLAVSEQTIIDVGGGFAYSDSPEALAEARASLPHARDLLNGLEDQFWEQLAVFMRKTQAAACERAAQVGRRQLTPWLAERVPTDAQHRLIAEHLQTSNAPTFGVLIVDRKGDPARLGKTIKSLSLENNLYAALRIVALTPQDVPQTSVQDKLRFIQIDGEQPLAGIDLALREGGFDWFVLVEAGCEFTTSGLMIAALDLIGAPGCRAVYGDEVVRQDSDDLGLALRPGLNLDMLLSLPSAMACHWLFNCKTWRDMGGFRREAGRAFELDYLLRLIEDKGLEGLGHISEPLLIREASPLRDSVDEREVIQRHLMARGFPKAAVTSRLPGHYDLDYGVDDSALVSILVHTQGSLAKARRCIETILEKTSYRTYEVLLLDQSADDSVLQGWLSGIEQLGTDSIRVLRFSDVLSLAQVRNQAAEHARGELLLWLDVGIAVLDSNWLHQLVNHAARQEVGAVGAKLLAGDQTIRHAGIILGLNGPVGRVFVGQPLEAPGYLQRLLVDQNYAAVSGKCLMLRKSLFLSAGRFDEDADLAPWADVDLCLRLHSAGFLNVWTPRAPMLINEEPEPAATTVQEDAMYARWLPLLARDPAYNPNFSLGSGDEFSIAPSKMNWRPLSSWRPVPTILGHAADQQGCGNYRVIQPLEAMDREGLIDGTLLWNQLSVTELERFAPDSIVLQRQVGESQIEGMRRMKAFSNAFKVFELDDYLPNLPMKSIHKAHMPKDIVRALRRGLSYVDRFVVSTEPLAEAFAGLHDDIRVVHNRLDTRWWRGLSSQRRCSGKPRVGWAGGVSHTGDLEMIVDVVKELANEVEWVFFGMCPDKLRPYVHEYHAGVPIRDYPAKLAQLNLDLAVAPVEQNLFNDCKSNLRLLEYGACGFPVICSDVLCYQNSNLPVTLVKNRFRDWVEAIRMHLADLDETARLGDRLRGAVQSRWMLEGDNLLLWREAWTPD